MKRCAAILLCMLLVMCVVAQTVVRQPMRFQRISSAEGLINDYVRCLYQDHLGYLWVGTFDGLCRWDGANFKTFRREFGNVATLPSNTILALTEDRFGIIWISSGKGMCSYDPRAQRITRHTLFPGEPVAYTMAMRAAGDTMLITTQTALYRFQIGGPGVLHLTARLPFPETAGVDGLQEKLPDAATVLHQGHVYHISSNALSCIQLKDEAGKDFPVADMGVNAQGRFYAGARGAGVLLYSRDGRLLQSYHPGAGTVGAGDRFNKILLPAASFPGESTVLLGSARSGIVKLDAATGAFTAYGHERTDPFSLSSNEVTDITETPNGFVFAGTQYGLNIYDSHNQSLQTTIITKNGEELQDLITDALEDENDPDVLWLGTSANGLMRYSRNAGNAVPVAMPAGLGAIRCLCRDAGGRIWIGAEGGLYNVSSHGGAVQKAAIAVPGISSIRESTQGTLLITSFTNGCLIYRIASGNAQWLSAAGNGLFSDRCSSAEPLAGTGKFAITHIGAGISILDPATARALPHSLQASLETELPYPATYTYCSYAENDSVLWIGTGLGLVRLNLHTWHAILIKSSTRLRTDSEIWSILPGGSPYLWLKTTFGAYLFNMQTGAILNFYPIPREHLPAQDGYFRMRRAGRRIIIPSFGAVHTLSMDLKDTVVSDMKIILSEVKVGGEPFLFHPDAREISLTLQPGHASLDVTFNAVQFRKTPYIVYMYKITGSNEHWQELGNKNALSFPNLDAGTYQLVLSARDFEGGNVALPLTINVRVKPYLWQSPWFYLALTLLLALGVYALYRYRLAQVLRLQHVRQKISKDLHDDIGATVSSIGILASMTRAREIPADRKEQFLQSIADDSRYVTEALSDIVWSINPRNDTLEHIFARLQRYASEMFEARDITYEMTLPEMDLHAQSLSMDARQQLLLIFKEAVNNLVKYSGASHAEVTFSIQGGKLTMRVSDDGKGFEPDAMHEGNGVHNMRKRAEELKGKLSIISKKDEGTTIILEVPM